MRSAATNASPSVADTLRGKANDLDLEVDNLRGVMQANPSGAVGDRLSLRMATILACATEGDLATLLSIPIELILAGRSRMYSLAAERVERGSVDLVENGGSS